MNVLCGERAIPVPNADPCALLAGSRHAGFFARLSDELLADIHAAHFTNGQRTDRIDCLLLDTVRAEFALRHAPADPRDAPCADVEALEPLYVQ